MTTYPLNSNPPVSFTAQRARPAWGKLLLRFSAVIYLLTFVAVPVIVVNVEGLRSGLDAFLADLTRPAAMNAIWLTLWTSAVMTVINVVMGTLTAYVLVVYRFPGKDILNTLVDLPFAIPTLVTGVMLVLLYGPQTAIGGFFQNQLGFKLLFAPPGIIIALLFVGYPFVIRAVQPVLLTLEPNQQEAAQTIGASDWYTFRRVILPAIRPAVVTGGLLSFARALGEFGAIIIVAQRPQVATVYLYSQVEAGEMQAASAVSVVLLLIAFIITLSVDLVESRHHA
ncbi:MAG: ABC transporter permease [Chloroflexi bacterium]|nr:ABC transporter permease [Chloroflexota bacterium]MCC6893692.1 ABC transporter permease [Anaerolineae bacterium]